MTASDFDIVIGRPSLSLPDLVLHGDRQPGICLMPNLTIPLSYEARNQVVESFDLDGSPVTGSTLADPILSGDVLPEAEDTADMFALVQELRVAISPLSFPVTVVWKGFAFPETVGRRGSLVISPVDWKTHIELDAPVFSLTIPCHPIPGA
jgi:hypothetical protein